MSDEAVAVLERIETWLALLARVQLRPVLEAELAPPGMARLYELTGTLSVTELGKKLGRATGSISNTWRRWEQLGLLVKEGRRYRKVL